MVKGIDLASYGEEYVVFLKKYADSIITGLSNGSIQALDPNVGQSSTKVITQNGTPLAGICTLDNALCSGSVKGLVNVWDPRTNGKPVTLNTGYPLASINSKGHMVAVGTELDKQDAGVLLYDIRKGSTPVVKYIDSHNDDVTDVQFHPVHANTLLSGSTDGIVNLYDTTIADEDDAVYQTFNHGSSIHRTEFISEKRLMALSHMETLSLYQVADPDENVEEPKPTEFGDLREKWNCEYVADFIDSYFLIGSNSESWLKVVPFQNESAGPMIELEGGHGEEVARCFVTIGNKIFTGGEDGVVKVWALDDAIKSFGVSQTDSASAKPLPSRHKHKSKNGKSRKSHNPY